MTAVSLDVAGVRHRYPGSDHDTPAKLSFQLGAGERALLLGRNGVGKTTLLHRVVGLLNGPGKVMVGGDLVEPKSHRRIRQQVGFLWQSPDDALLLPTVIEDVAFGPSNDGLDGAQAIERARLWLELLGIARLAGREVRGLSLGEKQLVALAGVLAREPGLLLLDEPTASLDEDARERLAKVLLGLSATMLLATHDADFWRTRGSWRELVVR